MVVAPSSRNLVLATDRYADVLRAIPHAKTFDHAGEMLTAVPHGIEETMVLRNLGYRDAPAPILSYYKWPARFAPMELQKTTSAFLTTNKRAICLNEPGTGKSISAL